MNETTTPSTALLDVLLAKIVEAVTAQVAEKVEGLIANKIEEAFDELDLEDKVEQAVEQAVERAIENMDIGDAVLEVVQNLDFSVNVSR